MSRVSDSDGDSDSLIDLSVYYDEYGNVVSESGYLLDENGNLVVCNDEGLTAAYSVTDNHGVTWILGEDAAIVDTMIRSTIDPEAGTTYIDQYGNAVTAEGYLVDQSDSDGGALIVSHEDLSIQEQVVTEVAAGDGTTYTFADGENATFTDTGTTAGNVYVQVSEVSETYYDEHGSQLTSSDTAAVLADSDGTSLSVTAAHVTSGYIYVDGDQEYATEGTGTSGSYYVVVTEGDEVTQFYVGETQLESDDSVYYDGTESYYILGDSVTLSSSLSAGVYAVADADAANAVALGATCCIQGATTSTQYTLTFADTAVTSSFYSGGSAVSYATALANYTNALFIISSFGSSDGSSSYAISSSVTANSVSALANAGTYNFYYWDGTTLYAVESVSSGAVTLSGDTLTGGTLYATYDVVVTESGKSGYLVEGEGTLTDDGSTASAAGGVTLTAGTYAGWQLAYDEAGNWVTLTSASGDTWYLADADGTQLVLSDSGSDLTDAFYYTQNGHSYYTTSSTTGTDGVIYYYDFTAAYSYSEYASTTGELSVDEEGYILDETQEERQVFTAATVYDYVQEVTYSDGTTVTYYYYFGSTQVSDYISEATYANGRDESGGYYVATGVMTTVYYDSYGNPLCAAGYIINTTTGNIITTSQTEVRAGYTFTSLNGITYTVSGEAYIEEDDATRIVYSGVSEIRCYGDDNDSGEVDEGDTEYTADELWVIIRNELDEITAYQSVASGETITAAQYRSGDYAL